MGSAKSASLYRWMDDSLGGNVVAKEFRAL
jgi:hypothetical protein